MMMIVGVLFFEWMCVINGVCLASEVVFMFVYTLRYLDYSLIIFVNEFSALLYLCVSLLGSVAMHNIIQWEQNVLSD